MNPQAANSAALGGSQKSPGRLSTGQSWASVQDKRQTNAPHCKALAIERLLDASINLANLVG